MPKPQQNPRQATIACNTGIQFLNTERPREAIPHLAQAASMSQDPVVRGTALKGLGMAYSRLHQHEQAVDFYRQAESIARKDAIIPMLLAQTLHSLERINEAADACRRAHRIDPENRGVVSLLVDCLTRLGRDDEAFAVIEDADRQGVIDPNIDETFGLLAMRTDRQQEALDRLRRHEGGHGLPPADHARVMFIMGDVLDSMGRYDEAWDAYAQANELRSGTFDPDQWVSSLRAMARAWDADLVSRLQEGASEDERPVLVVGMPRSGTTLVDMTLGRHSGVHMGGEMTALGDAFQLIAARIGVEPEHFTERITTDHVRESAAHYLGVMDRIGQGAARVTNKMPMNIPGLGLFAAMFPNGRIIHTRRDPRDVCLSCYFRNFRLSAPFTSRPEWLAGYYEGYAMLVRHWGEVYARLDRAPSIHEVTYEEMVANHESHARALVSFAGLGWEDECLDVGSSARQANTLRSDQVGQKVYTTSAQRHTRYARHVQPWEHLEAPRFLDP